MFPEYICFTLTLIKSMYKIFLLCWKHKKIKVLKYNFNKMFYANILFSKLCFKYPMIAQNIRNTFTETCPFKLLDNFKTRYTKVHHFTISVSTTPIICYLIWYIVRYIILKKYYTDIHTIKNHICNRKKFWLVFICVETVKHPSRHKINTLICHKSSR